MKVYTTPVEFNAGQTLDPSDLNNVFTYTRDVIADVASRRYTRSMLTYQFVTGVGTAYTNTANELLTYRFTCPNTCVIERAYLSANMTSSAEVKVDITTAAGGAVSGAVSPLLTTGGAVASAGTTVEDFAGNRIVLTAGAEYKITVSSTGTFTLSRFDVTLHVLTDRWVPSGTDVSPSLSPTLFDEGTAPDATIVNANGTAASTAASSLASYVQAPSPVLFAIHGLTNATGLAYRSFSLPRFDSARATSKIVAAYVYAFMNGTGGSTVTATIQDASVSTLYTATANVSGVPFASGGGVISSPLVLSAATTGISVDVDTSSFLGSDWNITLTNASATTTATKAYCILWLSR